MKKLLSAGIATLALLGAGLAVAADKGPPPTIKTVWLDGKGQSSMADRINKLHADMAAKGWRFVDLEIYTEDGDMEGVFVTYEMDATPAPAAQ
jgi:hypothetical protein